VVTLNQSVITSSRSIPANVCAAFDYILKIMNMMPAPGRDHVSMLGLKSSYKVSASKVRGRCPDVGGAIVPHNRDKTSDW
jgi:hypothetical protein